MLPLINETVEKINSCNPKTSQTGPAVRNDKSVLKTHENLLQQMDESLWGDIYRLMSNSIIELSKRP
jgi:hypothetical protein